MQIITIIIPDDFHAHFRRHAMMRAVVPYTARWFARALVMPNTSPAAILTGEDCKKYEQEIRRAAKSVTDKFEPIMTIKLTAATKPEGIHAACRMGITVGKAYPTGVTTNAEEGINDFEASAPIFAAMEAAGMVLSIHGELPSASCMNKETAFLPVLCKLATDFPKLRIVMEHLTTRKAVETIKQLPDTVGATITAHHLVLTIDDVIGATLKPHLFCRPLAQTPDDRQALIEAAISGNPKFWFGSDSAPHLRTRKEKNGQAGIFSAPVTLPILCQVFEQAGALARLESFTSVFGARFYDLPLNDGTIQLIKQKYDVPHDVGRVVPFMAGETLDWSVRN